jgi:methionyl aminopeptidase
VLNFGKKGKGELLREGMVIAIEPMLTAGRGEIIQTKEESYATADGSLSAHFEHTVAITKNGPRILTLRE